MTKIWRKKEWEQQLKNNPDACISIPKGLILNKSEAEIQKVKDEFGLQESDITSAEQNVEAESIKEETVEEDEVTQGEVPDPDNPPS